MERRTTFSAFESLFALFGAAIAGTLLVADLTGKDVPCTSGGGCELVNSSHWSHFGAIPVPAIGISSYLLLLAGAVCKIVLKRVDLARLILVGMTTLTLIGVCYSWYLQYVAYVFIGAFCIWCRASAITMTVLFLITSSELFLALKQKRINETSSW